MHTVNLIPIRHRQQRALRARRKTWIGVASFYAILLAAGYGGWRVMWGGDGQDLTRQLSLVRADVDDLNKSIAKVRGSLSETQGILRANQAVSGQPDWSVLLALIAKLRGDELVLHHCGLDTAQTPPPALQNVAAEWINTPLLKLQGYGKTQPAVSQFALRLEQTGLFESVSLLKTNRESFLAGEAIAFRLECRLKLSVAAPAPLKAKPPIPGVHAQGRRIAEISDAGDNAP